MKNQIRGDFGLNVRGVCGDACDLPFGDEEFDVVMSSEFFEHVADLDVAIKEQIRVLKTGGRLIIEQANLLSPFVLFDLLIRYPRRTGGQHGGLKWLRTKGQVGENMYESSFAQKDEDVHTRAWWKKKTRQYASMLEINEFTSFREKMNRRFSRLHKPLLGNILIIATKRLTQVDGQDIQTEAVKRDSRAS